MVILRRVSCYPIYGNGHETYTLIKENEHYTVKVESVDTWSDLTIHERQFKNHEQANDWIEKWIEFCNRHDGTVYEN